MTVRSVGIRTAAIALAAAVAGVVAAPAGALTITKHAPSGSPPASKCTACGHNLILNGGADKGPGTTDDTKVKVPHWKPKAGFTAASYKWSGGDLSATTVGPKKRGKNYFYGGPDARVSKGTQTIDVPSGGISSGKATFSFTGWLGGFSGQRDYATVTATFESSSGAELSTSVIGPVTEAQRKGVSELIAQHTTGKVPAKTAIIVVVIEMRRFDGSDNDGLADNLSLVLTS